MFKLNENELYELRQLKNKVSFILALNLKGGDTSPDITSTELATIFGEINQQLETVISNIEEANESFN
ncbi:hypothetical protein [Acinetobacter radioresistens]|nr:hypothetical protein [Acinetobacter radioresistens]RJL74408.1 hypothetical protein D5055_02725 [Acinetobacter radioresistens]